LKDTVTSLTTVHSVVAFLVRWSLLIGATALAGLTVLGTATPTHAQSNVTSSPNVTYSRDIAPLVFSHCASCHRPGGIGPFSLLTYSDARQRATQIAAVTARRLMPPWKPAHGQVDFLGDRSLSDAQIDLVQRWASQGAVEGNRADLPKTPTWSTDWQLGTPDLVVSMPAPYVVAADGRDVFRTFVIPIPTADMRYVKALEFRPGNARVVHHANLGIDRTRSSRRLDLLDAAPGYDGGMVPESAYPPGYMLGWTPGQQPRPSPEGMPWRLDGGSDLIVQLHLQPTGKPEPVQVSAGLYFTHEAPSRAPVGLRLGSETIEITAGEPNHVVTDSYVLPVDVNVLAVQPHAHNLARRMEGAAILPDGSTRPLITIADWDFRWQDVYRYAQPIALPKGTTVSMRFSYDNSAENPRNPNQPPRPIVWGPNTSDEMGDLWLQLVPKNDSDAALLNADINRKTSAQDLAGFTKLMNAEPANPLRRDTVAMLHLQAGHLDEAIAHFRESLALNRDSAPTHYNLALALSAQRKIDEAIVELIEALRLDPEYAEAHNNLAGMLLLRGRPGEAVEHYRRVIALRPESAEAHDNFGRGLASAGRGADAVEQFRLAATLKPEWAAPLAASAWVQATSPDASVRNASEAIRLAERAAAISGKQATVLDSLAAAYAAGGRFEEASAAAGSAIEAATRANMSALAAQIRQRLALYQRRQPYFENLQLGIQN